MFFIHLPSTLAIEFTAHSLRWQTTPMATQDFQTVRPPAPGLYACVCRTSANEEIQHHAYDGQ